MSAFAGVLAGARVSWNSYDAVTITSLSLSPPSHSKGANVISARRSPIPIQTIPHPESADIIPKSQRSGAPRLLLHTSTPAVFSPLYSPGGTAFGTLPLLYWMDGYIAIAFASWRSSPDVLSHSRGQHYNAAFY